MVVQITLVFDSDGHTHGTGFVAAASCETAQARTEVYCDADAADYRGVIRITNTGIHPPLAFHCLNSKSTQPLMAAIARHTQAPEISRA